MAYGLKRVTCDVSGIGTLYAKGNIVSDANGENAGVDKEGPREQPASRHQEKANQGSYPLHCRGGASWVEKNWYGISLNLGPTFNTQDRRS